MSTSHLISPSLSLPSNCWLSIFFFFILWFLQDNYKTWQKQFRPQEYEQLEGREQSERGNEKQTLGNKHAPKIKGWILIYLSALIYKWKREQIFIPINSWILFSFFPEKLFPTKIKENYWIFKENKALSQERERERERMIRLNRSRLNGWKFSIFRSAFVITITDRNKSRAEKKFVEGVRVKI